MKINVFLSVFFLLLFCVLTNELYTQEKASILLVTSNRKVPSPEFYELFKSIDGVEALEIKQPQANEFIQNGDIDKYALIVFYDLNDSITELQKDAYWDLLDKGKPMLFLHHTLVSYQKWPNFINIIGGRYNRQHPILGPSGFIHDYKLNLDVFDEKHPITSGLDSFSIIGEAYDNCEILPGVTPLLVCKDSQNMPYAAWIHRVKNAEVVYIQNGHDDKVFTNPHYKILVKQAVLYLIFHTKYTSILPS